MTAVVLALLVMYVSSGPVATFVANHPTTKMLTLAFLVLIGVALVADGFGVHIPRGYVYFAMAFSSSVEAFNIMVRRRRRRFRSAPGHRAAGEGHRDDRQAQHRGGDDPQGDRGLAAGDADRDRERKRDPGRGLRKQQQGVEGEAPSAGQKAAGEEARAEGERRADHDPVEGLVA